MREFFHDLWGIKGDTMNDTSPGRIIVGAIVSIVVFLLCLYAFMPAWNLHDVSMFWIVVITLAIFMGISGFYGGVGSILVLMLLFWVIASFASGALFNARSYSEILTVEEGSVENIPSVEDTDRIALMDTASAKRLGDREIGDLDDIVSQYEVSDDYVQINLGGYPMKVSPLEHAGFFKWIANQYDGVPGYVMIDPVHNTSEYVALDKALRYVPSAHFWQNLSRHLRTQYPSLMFESPHFEIDEENNPWYVAPTYSFEVGLWGGKQITGVIIVDPYTGHSDYYRVGGIPEWVDYVYDGYLICDQYNWYSQYQHGWLNSWIGQKDCREVTTGDGPDFGYLAIDDDIWVYTGITSVNGDSSNVGFILANERTEETLFIRQAGANEFSAMAAAEGEGGVVEKRYTASFPSLVRFGDEMAYLMVLKDDAGLVKMYAAVDVEQYNIVAAATVQNDTVNKFRAMLAGEAYVESGSDSTVIASNIASEHASVRERFFERLSENDPDLKTITVKVTNFVYATIDGNTYVYIVTDKGEIYYSLFTDVTTIIDTHEGDLPERWAILTDGNYFVFPS